MNTISKIIINCIENNKKIIIPEYLKNNLSISDGYFLQKEINDFFSTKNEFKAWKIGCTTPVMQKYLGISNPCLGKVMSKNLHKGNTNINFESFSRPGVECEIAVILSEDYLHDKAFMNLEDVISQVVPAIEIVDDRWENYKEENTPLLISDNFFSSSIVFGRGTDKIDIKNLKNLKGFMEVNNQLIGKGIGKDILEDPLNALKWFLDFEFDKNNLPKAGDIISLGSIVETYWVSKNDKVSMNIDELGSVEVSFI